MIRQQIYIDEYDWTVYCYYAVDTYYVEEIVDRLQELGCSGAFMERAMRNLSSGNLNNGISYSNMRERKSIMVVAITSSAPQFLNSLVHELRHIVNNICEASYIPTDSEVSCYLSGDIAQMIYPKVKRLMCDHCRKGEIR